MKVKALFFLLFVVSINACQPVEKEKNDSVFASTIVLSGKVYIVVEKKGIDVVEKNESGYDL